MEYVGYRTRWRDKKQYQIRGRIVRWLVKLADWMSPDVYFDYVGGPFDGQTGISWAAAVCSLNGTLRVHGSIYQMTSETEATYVGEIVYPEKIMSENPKTFYLIVDHDDHSDPIYYLRSDKDEALQTARRLADEAIERYGDMKHYVTKYDGLNGWWFSEYGEERWHITVREVKLDG